MLKKYKRNLLRTILIIFISVPTANMADPCNDLSVAMGNALNSLSCGITPCSNQTMEMLAGQCRPYQGNQWVCFFTDNIYDKIQPFFITFDGDLKSVQPCLAHFKLLPIQVKMPANQGHTTMKLKNKKP